MEVSARAMSGDYQAEEELMPERSDHDAKFWYIAGMSATALIAGLAGMFNFLMSYESLTMVGAISFIGCTIYQVMRDD